MSNLKTFAALDEANLNRIHLRITVLSALGEFAPKPINTVPRAVVNFRCSSRLWPVLS